MKMKTLLAPLASNLHNVWLTHLQVMQDLVTLPQRVRQVRETHSKSMVFLWVPNSIYILESFRRVKCGSKIIELPLRRIGTWNTKNMTADTHKGSYTLRCQATTPANSSSNRATTTKPATESVSTELTSCDVVRMSDVYEWYFGDVSSFDIRYFFLGFQGLSRNLQTLESAAKWGLQALLPFPSCGRSAAVEGVVKRVFLRELSHLLEGKMPQICRCIYFDRSQATWHRQMHSCLGPLCGFIAMPLSSEFLVDSAILVRHLHRRGQTSFVRRWRWEEMLQNSTGNESKVEQLCGLC